MSNAESKYEVAVVMPVLNEEKYIGRTLDQIYMQDFPMDRVEVVIADGGSTDRTREIAESYKNRFGSLKVVNNPGRLSSAGRNVGIKNSTAPYIIVLDGHSHIPSKNLFKDMVELFRTTEARCLCRAQPMTPPDINEFELAVAYCRASAIGHNPVSDIYSDYEGEVDPTSSGAMYHRSVFEEVGYFDENFDACEDVDFNYRVKKAGLKSILSPRLRVFYYPRSSLQALWKQMVRYGRGRFRFASKHRLFSLIQWLAGAAVLIFAALLLLSFFSDSVFDIFKNLIALYLLMNLFFSAYLAVTKKHMGCLLYGVLIYPVIHFGLGIGFLSAMIDHYLKK
jgi:GT2 family glycosyltransferase